MDDPTDRQNHEAGDVVARIQDEIARLCAGFFNFVGALQRDAPPSSISGENILRPRMQGYDLEV